MNAFEKFRYWVEHTCNVNAEHFHEFKHDARYENPFLRFAVFLNAYNFICVLIVYCLSCLLVVMCDFQNIQKHNAL